MSASVSISGKAKWLMRKDLQKLFGVLCDKGGEARIAGGAVRNTLLGETVSDIDIATTLMPDEVIKRCGKTGFRTIPTGIEHGTVTVITGKTHVEVTTLRADIETDGRHAVVEFGKDWRADAERRDFTINALYADADGKVHDFVGGLADIDTRTIRFIGSADDRIQEDYLRILRFFRFFARYGSGRPDAGGLKACARHKGGLAQLSAERVWSELKKILGTADPSRALLWMRQTGVLSSVLPESEKWGIDLIGRLVRAENAQGWPADALVRLQAIVPPDVARMTALAARLRLSTDESARLSAWARAEPVAADTPDDILKQRIYREGRQPVLDRLRLSYVAGMPLDGEGTASDIPAGLLHTAQSWPVPELPIMGRDLIAAGFQAGPELGAILKQLEDDWVANRFEDGKKELLAKAFKISPRT